MFSILNFIRRLDEASIFYMFFRLAATITCIEAYISLRRTTYQRCVRFIIVKSLVMLRDTSKTSKYKRTNLCMPTSYTRDNTVQQYTVCLLCDCVTNRDDGENGFFSLWKRWKSTIMIERNSAHKSEQVCLHAYS